MYGATETRVCRQPVSQLASSTARIQTSVCPSCCQQSQPHAPLPCVCSVTRASPRGLTLSHVPTFHSVLHLATWLRRTFPPSRPGQPHRHAALCEWTLCLCPSGLWADSSLPWGSFPAHLCARPCSFLADLMGHVVIGKAIIKFSPHPCH